MALHLFCRNDCKELSETLEKASRDVRALKSDLEDLWDRFARLQGRLSKRGQLPADPPNGKPAVDRDAELNAEIHQRRRGHGVPA